MISKGDAVMFHGDNYGMIDYIFLFDVYGTRHIFAVVTPLERTDQRDELLGLEIMSEQEDAPIIIGITAIEPAKPYVVLVPGIGHVLNNWDIKLL